MIKQFTYNVIAEIVISATGVTDTITQLHTATVPVDNSTQFIEFSIADDSSYYINDKLTQYLTDNSLELSDIYLNYVKVVSNDPYVSIYFKTSNSPRLDIDQQMMEYVSTTKPLVATPTGFAGIALSTHVIKWSWNEVQDCSYIIKDFLGATIADIGAGITYFVEEDLEPNNNYTRKIMAFDGVNSSVSSGYVTAMTEPNPTRVNLSPFTIETHRTIEPVDVDVTPPNDSSLFRSGIGCGDDLLCTLSEDSKEVFIPNVSISVHNKEVSTVYNEKVFQYRQKSTADIKRIAQYGRFDYEIYSHFKEEYSFTVFANVYAPLNENRILNINLDTSGVGIGISNKEFKYKINVKLYNKPINLKKRFTFKLNVAYDTSFSFLYRIKYLDTSTLDVEYSDWYAYDSLKSYEKYTILDQDNKIEDLITGDRDRANLSVEVDDVHKSIIFIDVNEDGYIIATNYSPDSYSTDYIINSYLYTETNKNGKEIVTLGNLVSGTYPPRNGATTYTGTNYGDFIYTIKDMSLPSVTLRWNNSVDTDRIGPDTITASTITYLGLYEYEDTFIDNITTSLHDSTVTKVLNNTSGTFILKCSSQPTGNSSETVDTNDQIYNGSLSGSVCTLTKVLGDVTIKWNDSGNLISTYTDCVHVTASSTIANYTKSYIIQKTIQAGKTGTIILITKDDLAKYKPYYNGLEWPYSIDDIKYRLGEDKLNILLNFDNGQKISTGTKTILGSIQTESVLFSKSMNLSGYICDYECKTTPKFIINKYDIVPVNHSNQLYSGDQGNIVYQIINNSPSTMPSIINDDILVDIVNPRNPKYIKSDSIWVNGNGTVINMDDADLNRHPTYSVIKTGGHTNTIGRWSDTPQSKVKEIGDVSYTASEFDPPNTVLNIYANKEEITIEDTEYTQWQMAVLNKDNVLSTLSIEIEQMHPDGLNKVNALEISPIRSDISWRIDGSSFVIYNTVEGEDNITISEAITTVESANTTEYSLYNDSVLMGIHITIENPNVLYPDKTYILQLKSNNPNIELSLSNPVIDLDNLTIFVDAKILIQSQSPWLLTINPGYLYVSAKEYYLYGKPATEKTILVIDDVYELPDITDKRSPIIVTDKDGLVFTKVPSNIVIEEVSEVINNKYIYVKYCNIDIDTVRINGSVVNGLTIIDNTIILPSNLIDSSINIRYRVNNSFCVTYNDNKTIISVHGGSDHKVYYETGDRYTNDMYYINPLRTEYNSGFLYVKD